MKNLGKVLEAAGCSYQNLIKTTVYIKDMNDFDVMNKAYGEVRIKIYLFSIHVDKRLKNLFDTLIDLKNI